VVLDLVIIGLAITLEPLTIVAFILLLASRRGTRKGLAFILGWTACLVAVIAAVLSVTGGRPPRPHTAPSTAVLVVKALLGILLIWVGLRRRRRGRPRKPPAWMGWLDRMSPWAAVGFGAFMQPWSLVAIGAATVVQAKLSTVGDWLALVLFCLLATSSFLVMELYAVLSPEAAGARLGRVRTWIDRHMDQAVIVGSLGLGSLLLADSIFLLLA